MCQCVTVPPGRVPPAGSRGPVSRCPPVTLSHGMNHRGTESPTRPGRRSHDHDASGLEAAAAANLNLNRACQNVGLGLEFTSNDCRIPSHWHSGCHTSDLKYALFQNRSLLDTHELISLVRSEGHLRLYSSLQIGHKRFPGEQRVLCWPFASKNEKDHSRGLGFYTTSWNTVGPLSAENGHSVVLQSPVALFMCLQGQQRQQTA